ncbi:MAG: hypothetical protein ACRCXK_00395 [Wohlfahrtiimonas sp.]
MVLNNFCVNCTHVIIDNALRPYDAQCSRSIVKFKQDLVTGQKQVQYEDAKFSRSLGKTTARIFNECGKEGRFLN